MVDSQCRWAVLEATSHGLVQHRLDCCEFDIAAVTTIGTDHLDFHGDRENYILAKARLFQFLGESSGKGIAKTAVLNADDPEFERLRRTVRGRVVSYGLNQTADLWVSDRDVRGWNSAFTLHTPGGSIATEVRGPAIFSVQNALAATGVCLAAGLELEQISGGLATWTGAPGRMELVDAGQPFSVVVDFAHSADALQHVLEVLRQHRRGRVIALFGCIGEREHDRRFAMGQVSARYADFTIVTDDNPYTEDRDEIIREIVRGLEASGKRRGHDFAVIPDRRQAIAHALAMAVDDDMVLLAGKGHETQVHLPDGVYDCDDRVVARATLTELVGRPTTS
jgi:UDP-N-acetylmuramyl-tripeptide synthetase